MTADAEAIARALGGAKKAGAGWNCLCPAHEDAKASLNIAIADDGKILVRCYAGCEQDVVLGALRERGLLNGHRSESFDFTISALGKPIHVWTYRDATGTRESLKVARYVGPHGKEFRPWIPDAGGRWKAAAHPVPRPLYRLELLARLPALPVIVVEGEKACDAAAELLTGKYVATTWPGGAKAADRADWKPLQGRSVMLWPDADEAGYAAMRAVAAKLAGTASKIILVDIGDDRPKGWDIADAKADGWTADDTLTFIDERAKPVEAPAANETSGEDALDYVFAHELAESGDEADELIEHMLTRGAMSVIYGDSNSGKTFLAIDIGCALARHVVWMRRNVEAGMLVYLASESPASVRRRLRAYQRHHGCRVPNFAIVQSPIDLYGSTDDTERIIELVRALEQRLGVKCQLIIGDTLSRLCAGANENAGEDMSVVVRHVDRIRREVQVHFLLIHHTGKDAARGMRGWSGMRAATDTEIEVSVDDQAGIHVAEITKQRDIPGKGERIGFRLQVVEMGVGKWGKPITSCVVIDADAPLKQTQNRRTSEIAGAIVEYLSARGTGIKKGDLIDHFDGRYTRSAVYRELKRMTADRKLTEVVGVVALVRDQAAALVPIGAPLQGAAPIGTVQ